MNTPVAAAGRSLWIDPPVYAALVGMCPLLARSTTLLSALVLGGVILALMPVSAATVSLCRGAIPPRLRLLSILLILVTWVTLADLLLQAWLFPMRQWLGIYLPLLGVNCLVLGQLEEDAVRQRPLNAMRNAGRAALAIGLLLLTVGVVRELLATGGLFSDLARIGLDGNGLSLTPVRLPVLAAPAGALFAFAFVIAAFNRLRTARGASARAAQAVP